MPLTPAEREQRMRRLFAAPAELQRAKQHTPIIDKLMEQYMQGDIGYLEMLERCVVELDRSYWEIVRRATEAAQRSELKAIEPLYPYRP